MSSSTYFGNLDFRNAKFQGSIRENTIDGIGIFLDHQFMWALSSWKDYVPNGPSLVVYSNRDIFYGRIKDTKLNGVCSLMKLTGENYFFNFVEGMAERISHLAVDGTVMQIEESGGRLRMVSSYDSKGSDELKWKIIGDILRTAVPPTHRNPKIYIREVIKREYNDIIECSQSAGGAFIGFKNTLSLGIKIGKHDKIMSVGSYESFPRNLQFGRVYTDRGSNVARISKVEQGKFGENQRVFVYQGKRPPQAIKFTQQFFKRGTSFKNIFVKFPVLQQISRYLQQTQVNIKKISILEYGQKILEGYQSNTDIEQKEKYSENKEYTIDEMKQEIYAMVTRRNSSRRGVDRPLLQPDLRSSRERVRFIEQGVSQERSSPKDSPRHRSKYKYMDQLAKENQPMPLTQKKRRYAEPFPETSEFNQRLEEHILNLQMARIEQNRRRTTPQRLFRPYEDIKTNSVYIKQKAVPDPVIKIKMVPSTSPIKQHTFRKTPVKSVESPISSIAPNTKPVLTEEVVNWQPAPEEQSKFQNYFKYKNRKRAEGNSSNKKVYTMQQEQTFNQLPNKKYEIYERRVFGTTVDPQIIQPSHPYLQVHEEKTGNSQKLGTIGSGLPRYRKNYKYL